MKVHLRGEGVIFIFPDNFEASKEGQRPLYRGRSSIYMAVLGEALQSWPLTQHLVSSPGQTS